MTNLNNNATEEFYSINAECTFENLDLNDDAEDISLNSELNIPVENSGNNKP